MGWVCLCGAALFFFFPFGSTATNLRFLALRAEDRWIKESSIVRRAHHSRPRSARWFKYQLNSANALPIKARDESRVMYAPSCSAPRTHTHTHTLSSAGCLWALKFIWGIKNPLSLDPIDIWASISEIITASGQYPSTFCSTCVTLGWVGWRWGRRCSRTVRPEGCSLVLSECVCVCVCVCVSQCCTVRTHSGCMQRVWKCERVILSLLYLGERRP